MVPLGMNWNSEVSTLPDHVQFIRGIDWASTDLGPPEQWPQLLNLMVDLTLADPAPASVMWGDRLTMIYNEHFVEFAGSKHPNLMGGTPVVEYAEVWDTMFASIIKLGREKGEATRHKDVCLYLHRRGYLEEAFVTYTFVPILGTDKTVVGFYHTAVETTDQVLGARRAQTLLSIGDHATSARTLDKYWETVLKGFESNPADIPYAIAYHFKESHDKDSISSSGSDNRSQSSGGLRFSRQCTFVGAIGKPALRLPMSFDTNSEQDDFVMRVHECTRNGQPLLLEHSAGTLPDWLYEEGWGDPSSVAPLSAVVLPIRPTTRNDREGSNAIGFLIIGLNPHRKYDREYEQFIHLCSRQLATSAASVMLLEQEVHRQKKLAAQLSISAKHQQQSEARFRRFAELADVAIWIVDAENQVVYANKAWRDQTSLSEPDPDLATWISAISDQSRPKVERAWSVMVETKTPQVFECELRSLWSTVDASTGETVMRARWVLCSAFPDLAEDGSLQGIWACNTDISHQKWAEALKEQRLADLMESKRQSENFIDMVSHEMRNPLSAIMQCADGIASSLRDAQDFTQSERFDAFVESMLELAQTIVFCAQHQTRIVNDILTLSRLDSSLLTVSLVAVDPVSTLNHALKIHQQELQTSRIGSEVLIESSYHSVGIDKVFLDPSRLLQLLINLISNAIKFTNRQEKRCITLRLGAALTDPGKEAGKQEYFVLQKPDPSKPRPEQDSREEVFILFAVEDTGCGLKEEEIDRLFMRFSQASPRTHVQYGGSGLGLFICKELVELCGGRIGVTSEPGKGSTFKFYLPAQRAPREATIEQQISKDQKMETVLEQSTRFVKNAMSEAAESRKAINGMIEGPTSGKSPARKISQSLKLATQMGNVDDTIHVLVVEDNLINQRIMAQQLRKAGCVVHVANHGADALELLKRTTFDHSSGPDPIPLSLILMDLEMPVMDGLTCIRRIRALQKSGELINSVPVLAVTANARPEQVQKAKEAGMDDIVTKPVRIPALMEQMRNFLASR